MSNISNEVSTPCNKLWLNSNNVITIMIIISCTSMMRHAKGPILCLFCNAQNFSLRKLWKKVVLVNKTFFGHVPSLSPYHYVQLTCRNELYWPEKITFWRRKNWIRKRKNKIQNCKWKKRQLEKGLLSSTKLYMLHDVRNGQRTIEGNRLLFIKRNAKLYIKLQSKNLFWKRIKTYERRTKNRRLLSQTYEIEVAFKEIYRLQLIVTYDPNMQHFHKKRGQ